MPDCTKIREPAVQHCPWLKLGDGSISEEFDQSRGFILNTMGGPVDGKVEVCVVEYDIR